MKDDSTKEVDVLLEGVSFPATAEELASTAEEHGASAQVINFFESLAPDTMFTDRSEVLSATGQLEAAETPKDIGGSISDDLTDDYEDTL